MTDATSAEIDVMTREIVMKGAIVEMIMGREGTIDATTIIESVTVIINAADMIDFVFIWRQPIRY